MTAESELVSYAWKSSSG